MKYFRLLIAIGLFLWIGCAREDEQLELPGSTPVEIDFTGTWSRQFEAGPGKVHTATYFVYQDSIRYTLTGPVGQADYVMIRDAYSAADHRFVGHRPDGQHYLVLVKAISEESITLYKQTVADLEEGLARGVPPDNTNQNHGWNTYQKQ